MRTKLSLQINKMCYAALFLALGWLLPSLTGHIQTIGSMLSPMHIPVMVCGFVLGPIYGLVIGFVTPLTRTLIFGSPILFPTSIAMAFELATYGLICGLSFKIINRYFPKIKVIPNTLISLIIAMILGRCIYGLVAYLLTFAGAYSGTYTFYTWISGTILTTWPGIILQIVFVPLIIRLLYQYRIPQKFSPELFIRKNTNDKTNLETN